MRCDLVLGSCLVAALAAGFWLWGQYADGQRRIAALETDIAALEAAREADQQALAVYRRARDAVARESQEKRDALGKIAASADDLSDFEFLDALRGMCPAGSGARCAGPAGGTAGGMPASAGAGVNDAR